MRTLPLVLLAALFGCRDNEVPQPVDSDGDGVFADADCNDNDPIMFPGAVETCDGVDNDCNGIIDNDPSDASTWFSDVDGDGYGSASSPTESCDQPVGTVADSTDCDDSDAMFHPGATESDCTDSSDYNCDDSVGYADVDGDGYAACADCDDTLPSRYPDAVETCDDVDNDCDGAVDEAGSVGETTFYADDDADGFGDATDATTSCAAPEGYVANNTDCNDTSDVAYPGGVEVCDDVDNDCDGNQDEDDASDASTWYADGDADGFGDASTALISCDQPVGFTADSTDCDDADNAVNTAATESCDQSDNNCDGVADEGFDADNDGYTSCVDDCNDDDGAINPGAGELCDGVDNDCSGDVDEGASDESTYYLDYDGDGTGGDAYSIEACSAPAGFVSTDTDCDDLNADFHPSAAPGCDGQDYDCDGAADNDADDDGYSDAACGGLDCDDADAALKPEVGGGCAIGLSCNDILSRDPSAANGVYTVDVDGFGVGEAPFDTFCDMVSDGGGWTLVASVVDDTPQRSSDVPSQVWQLPGENHWADRIAFGDVETATETVVGSFKNAAYWEITASDIMVYTVPNDTASEFYFDDARFIMRTENNFLDANGGTLFSLYNDFHRLENGPRAFGYIVDNVYDKGTAVDHHAELYVNSRNETQSGGFSFASINNEGYPMAFCPMKTNGYNSEHWCVGGNGTTGGIGRGGYGNLRGWAYSTAWGFTPLMRAQTLLIFTR